MAAIVDTKSTSLEWQRHTGTIAILPIGSFEQHGHHLPLDTDITGAGYFAAMLADDLGAALLPVLPFGTCMEHTGFRGSISLRPETLMATIRDIAGELQRQNFKVMIVLNGHGGNFSLAPAIRDINRNDQPLKVLLVNWWEAIGHGVAAESNELGMDLHAGEMETSLMLAMCPDEVRAESIDAPPASGQFPLRAPDLNTFGMGHMCATGAVGYPSFATVQKGEVVIESVRAGMLPLVRERLARLQAQRRYAGAGGIALRPMITADIPDGMRLCAAAGWNQTERDWEVFLQASPDGCFVAVHNGRVVGSAATITYGNAISWISMVLVEPDFRGAGIGGMLFARAVEHLKGTGAIMLDATPQGRELYREVEFNDCYRLHRMIGRAVAMAFESTADPRPLTADDLPAIEELDGQAFGAARGELLSSLRAGAPNSAWCVEHDGKISGFCVGRAGTNFHQIGPVVAASTADAQLLIVTALNGMAGSPVVLDVPEAHTDLTAWLHGLGFTTQRPFIRMVHGQAGASEPPASLYAICGPEFG